MSRELSSDCAGVERLTFMVQLFAIAYGKLGEGRDNCSARYGEVMTSMDGRKWNGLKST